MNSHEAVARGAEIMAELERAAKKAKSYRDEMRQIMQTVRDEGHIGPLECEAMARDFAAIVTAYDAALYVYHSKATLRCRELGIDLPQRDGGR